MTDSTVPSTSATRHDAVSGIGLAALTVLHVLAAVCFLVVLVIASGRAHAGEMTNTGDRACDGHNLLKSMATSDPDELSRIRREADAVPNGKSRFFKIEKAGVDPSWLYGTMHVTDPRVLELPKKAVGALDAARTVVIESTEILDPAKAGAAILAKPELTMFTDGKTLAAFLDDKDLKLVKAALKKRGLSYGLVERMKPWIIASFLALPQCEQDRKTAGVDFLDKKIAEDAKAQGKSVKGLETLDEQFKAMASLPMKFHIRGLVETLELGDVMDDVMATMTDLYLKGEIGTILPMLRTVAPEGDDASSGYASFEERIILKRNAVMARRAAPILQDGNAFVAVGALHLPGKEGVVERLRKAGYAVSPVM